MPMPGWGFKTMAAPVSLSPSPEKREYSILASVAGSTEIPVNLVPVQSDHSLHCGNSAKGSLDISTLQKPVSSTNRERKSSRESFIALGCPVFFSI